MERTMLNQLNVKLIERTAQWIEDHPNHYLQTVWGNQHEPDDSEEFFYDVVLSCNTPCCIAVHFVALGMYEDDDSVPDKPFWPIGEDALPEPYQNLISVAQRMVGLPKLEANRLFWGMWPEEWVQEDEGPLTLPVRGIGIRHFYPSSRDAIHVLRRLAKYGFQEK